jgi:exonuclease SbcC
MAITRLKIVGFQKHEKPVDLEIAKLTTFVGASDSGKSAILRALTWVLTNQPRGNAFINHNVTECKVGAVVDGVPVIRTKGSQNEYLVNKVEFKSFGLGVPNELEALTKLSPASIQRQMDPPFWLTLSPKNLAKELNEICNYELLDKIQRKAKYMDREARDEVAKNETMIEDRQQALDDLPSSPELYAAAEELQSLGVEVQELTDLRDDTWDALTEINQVWDTVTELPAEWEAVYAKLQEIERLDKDLSVLHSEFDSVEDDMDSIHFASRSVESLKRELDLAQQVLDATPKDEPQPPTTETEICPTCKRPL